MRQPSFTGYKPVIAFFSALFFFSVSQAQTGSIDWSKDTIPQADALGAKNTYLNTIRGSGQRNATERINLPVSKLKEVMDACAANNITEVTVMIVSLRPSDVSRYRKINPESAATNEQLTGSQVLVFKVPRRAFSGVSGAKANLSSHPAMVSLLASGLALLDHPYAGLPRGTEDLYFIFGSICPPPASCD